MIGNGGSFAQTILQALQQSLAGATSQQATGDGSASNAATATPDIGSALQSFMQNLFGALHQFGGQAQVGSGGADADGGNDGSKAAGGNSNGVTLKSFLQNLQQDLGSGDVTTGSVVSTQA